MRGFTTSMGYITILAFLMEAPGRFEWSTDWRLNSRLPTFTTLQKALGDLLESEVSNPALFASEIAVLLPDTFQDVANSSIIAACWVQSVTD